MRQRRGLASLVLTAALVLSTIAIPLVLIAPTAKAVLLYNSGNPTPDEQLVLEYINRARADPIAEGQRLGIDIHEGLDNPSYVGPRPPLAMNPLLLSIASAHSYDMYSQNYFSHNDPNGTTPFQRMTHAGYNFLRAGEDMAAGTDFSAAQLEDFMMVDAGTPGRPHRVNLLDIWPYPCGSPPCIYSEIGVGYYEGATFNSIGNSFITEDFGASNAGPFLLGVVYNDKNGNNFYDIGEGIAGVTITTNSGGYYAVSSSSGGYAIPIDTSGTITVTASGPGFGPITKPITLTGANVKLDFTSQNTPVTTSTTSFQTTHQTSATSFQTFTSQTSSQLVTQTSTAATTFLINPQTFLGAATPGTITACGNTFANGQTTSTCGNSFTAKANLPTPSSSWRFDHWVWTGVVCSSVSADSLSCTGSSSGGALTAVYAAQVNIATNPASYALIAWGDCASQEHLNGDSVFTTSYGSATATACFVPAGYTISSWTCSGGLACTGSDNPTTVTFSGPGKITLNLQPQATTTTSSNTTSNVTSTDSTFTTNSSPEFPTSPIITVGAMFAALLSLLARKLKKK